MNYIWAGMILISLIAGGINGTLDTVVTAGMEGAQLAVETVLGFAGGMCLWTGLMHLAEAGGFSAVCKRFLRPLNRFLFPGLSPDSPAMEKITMNMTANLLGMGNAATPAGMAAMGELDKINPNPAHASDAMCMFVVVNTASLQLIPSTIIAMRAAAGSQNPFSIIVPVWICSGVALLCAVLCMKLIIALGRGGGRR